MTFHLNRILQSLQWRRESAKRDESVHIIKSQGRIWRERGKRMKRGEKGMREENRDIENLVHTAESGITQIYPATPAS